MAPREKMEHPEAKRARSAKLAKIAARQRANSRALMEKAAKRLSPPMLSEAERRCFNDR